MTKQTKYFYEFGPFRIDPVQRVLLRGEEMMSLPPKVFDILQVLVENNGEIVSKDELMRRVWPDSYVEEGNLPVNIFALRKALGQNGDQNQFIKTVPKRGYLFATPVAEVWDEKAKLPAPSRKFESTTPSEVSGFQPESGSHEALDQKTKSERGWRPNHSYLVLSILLIVLAAFWTVHYSRQIMASASVRSVAVLPFKTISAEPEDDYLGPAVADTIVAALTNIKPITVRPIRASLKYTSGGQDPVEAGRALQAQAVLEGSIRKVGNHLRLTAHLVRTADGARLWEFNPVEEFDNILMVQQAMPRLVTRALAPDMTDREMASIEKHQTDSPEACQFYLKGRYLCNQMTSKEVIQGMEYFKQATRVDPNYAEAYAALAAFQVLPLNPEPGIEKMQKVKAAAVSALERDETLVEAHAALGRAILYCDWDWAGAEKELKQAIHLNPNYINAHIWYSNFLSALGRHDEAIAEMKWAREIDPSSPRINLILGYTLYTARRYEQAIEQLRKTPLELDAIYHQVFQGLGLASSQQTRYEEAIAAFQKAVDRSGQGASAKAHLAYAYAKSGRRDQSRKILDELSEPSERKTNLSLLLAATYAALDEREKTFELLEQAYADRDHRMIYLNVDPIFDSVRADPRFQEFVRRIGLTP